MQHAVPGETVYSPRLSATCPVVEDYPSPLATLVLAVAHLRPPAVCERRFFRGVARHSYRDAWYAVLACYPILAPRARRVMFVRAVGDPRQSASVKPLTDLQVNLP